LAKKGAGPTQTAPDTGAIQDHLSIASLDWSLHHHLSYGDTDLFPRPFEFEAIASHWPRIRSHLASLDLRQHRWSEPRRFLVPKDDLLFRTGVQLDPIDSLIFAALIHEIGPRLEARRLPISAEAVFSSRFDPDTEGRLYSQSVSWTRFWTKSIEYAEGVYTHVLVCDIADFYQQVDHLVLRQQLELASVPAWCLAALDAMLAAWHGEAGRGVPVGPHAAHLLAEVSLVPLDNMLSGAYPQYCRFIDDVHIFCKSPAEAHVALYELANTLDGALRLWTSGRKTRLMPSQQFLEMANANVKKDNLRNEERRVLEIVQEVVGSPYSFASFEEVSDTDREALGPEVVDVVLAEYLNTNEPDYAKIRWLLRRLTQVGAPGAVDFVIRNLPRLTAAMPDVIAYLRAAHQHYEGDWEALGTALIGVLDYPLVQRSEYLQLGILSLFAPIADLNHFQVLAGRFRTAPSDARREIILAARASGATGWLESVAASTAGRTRWEARAVLYAAELLSPVYRKRLKEEIASLVDRLLEEILLESVDHTDKASTSSATPATVPLERVPFRIELQRLRGKTFDPAPFVTAVRARYQTDLAASASSDTLLDGETHLFDLFAQDINANRLSQSAAKAGAEIVSLVRSDTREYVYELTPAVRVKRRRPVTSVPSTQLKRALSSVDLLIVTTTDTERNVVLQYLEPLRQRGEVIEGSLRDVSLRIGRFGRYAAAWVQTEMGSQQRSGSALTLLDAIDLTGPKAVIIIGIAFGIDRSKQRLGDVLVATSIEQYEHQKINARSPIQRGQTLPCGVVLAERFRTRGEDWTMKRLTSVVTTHHGPVLSGEKLINNREFRDRLVEQYPMAIGGEMEGAGAYAAANRRATEIILVKGICDWADGEKNSLAQPFACAAAVSFAHYVLNKPDVLEELGARDLLSKQ